MEINNAQQSLSEDEDTLRKERVNKQLYLNECIVNKGYSKEKFAIFANSLKDWNGNIDLWSFEELKTLVDQFQLENSPEPESLDILKKVEENYKTVDSSDEMFHISKEIIIPKLNWNENNLDNKNCEFEDVEIINLSPSNKENLDLLDDYSIEYK